MASTAKAPIVIREVEVGLVLATPEQIARRAYEIWEGEGKAPGKDQEHWFQAISELTSGMADDGDGEGMMHHSDGDGMVDDDDDGDGDEEDEDAAVSVRKWRNSSGQIFIPQARTPRRTQPIA